MTSTVAGFLRVHKDAIVRVWEERVCSDPREVALTGLALRDDIPALLDELAAWLAGDALSETSPLAARALKHVMQRLDEGLALTQVFREYRLLREAIIEFVLEAEGAEQKRTGASGEGSRVTRIQELARLNAGLDVVLSQSIDQFVTERDRRAAVERARAGQAVRESEARYRSLFESIDEGFCVIEVLFEGERAVDYRFLEVNPSFERHTGLKNATGRRVRELVPDHDEHWFEAYGRVARTGEPARFENAAMALGRFYDVFAFRVGAPEQRQVAVVFKDITERKRAAEALRVREERQAFLLRLSDAVRTRADSAEIQRVAAQLLGEHLGANQVHYGETEGDSIVVEQGYGSGLPPMVGRFNPTDFGEQLVAAFRAGRTAVCRNVEADPTLTREEAAVTVAAGFRAYVAVPLVKDGKWIAALAVHSIVPREWTQDEVALVEETAERTWAAVVRARAEAALREANERLVEADRRKTEFLGMLSHELRNPLAPIRNSLYILDRAAPGGEQARRAQAVIDRQSQHMARLIDDLLDVTRITRGKIQLQRERLALDEVVLRTLEDHRSTFEKAGVELVGWATGQPVWVHGDRTRIAQAVGNLLHNAAKFTPRGGKATVSVKADTGNSEAVIEVRDTGRGIDEKVLRRLFEPFTQADVTLDRSMGGLGLGLSLVKGLVELHGGTVAAQSEGKDRGATFTIRLPLATAAMLEQVTHAAQTASSSRRVLVVEDNPDSASSLQEVLELEGHLAAVASTGEESLELARHFHPQFVLCDLGLPGMDGYAVARALRAEFGRALTLVALSGYAQPEDHQRSRAAGFDAHLAKPVDIQVLARLLEKFPADRFEAEGAPA